MSILNKQLKSEDNLEDIIHPETSAQQVLGLSPVATTGDYNSLNNKPVIPVIPNDIVKFTPQVLTDEEKQQARNNIGASDFSGDYNDLTNKPVIEQTKTIIVSCIQSLGTNYDTTFIINVPLEVSTGKDLINWLYNNGYTYNQTTWKYYLNVSGVGTYSSSDYAYVLGVASGENKEYLNITVFEDDFEISSTTRDYVPSSIEIRSY